MAEQLPYMNSTGLIPKILEAIKSAKTPDRFSQDFLESVLGFSGGSARPFIPLAKRLSLINSDGTPSALYSKFRGSKDESQAAMASAVRVGYGPLYRRNEFADRLDKKKLEGLVREVTGLEENSSALRAMIGTYFALKPFANFDADMGEIGTPAESDERGEVLDAPNHADVELPLRFGWTININLPNTNDISVFNAIFKSLKEHLK